MPLLRRIPKRGFRHEPRSSVSVQEVNVGRLNRFEAGATVDPEALLKAGVVGHRGRPVKILGEGALTRKLTVRAHRFSRGAREKILRAGGAVEALEGPC